MMDGVLPDLDQRLRHHVPDCSTGLPRWLGISSLLLHEGGCCRGNGSKDFILIPDGSHGAIVWPV